MAHCTTVGPRPAAKGQSALIHAARCTRARLCRGHLVAWGGRGYSARELSTGEHRRARSAAEIPRISVRNPMNRLSFSCVSAALSAFCLLGCGNTDAPPRDYGSLLQDLTAQVIVPEHGDFATQASDLVTSVSALVNHP